MKARSYYAGLIAVALGLMGALPVPERAAATTILGSAADYTVLGASEVTNVPTSTIGGNVGIYPAAGTFITGFTQPSDSQVSGTVGVAPSSANSDLTTAITDLNGLASSATTIAFGNLTGLTLSPGVYEVPYAATNLAGTLILNGEGELDPTWVFLFASSLITSSGAVVEMENTSGDAGLYWDVGSSAMIGSSTTFLGNILAYASVNMYTSATDACGSVLAETAAVTLQENTIDDTCTGTLAESEGLSGGSLTNITGGTILTGTPAPIPEPSTFALLGAGLAGFLGLAVRRRRAQLA